MAGGVFKGLTIELGADSGALDSALKSSEKAANKLQKELKQVKQASRLDGAGSATYERQMELLAKSADQARKKAELLKKAMSDPANQGKITDEQYTKLRFEIEKAEAEVKKFEKEMRQLATTQGAANSVLGQTGEKLEEIGQKVGPVGEKLQSIGGTMTATVTAPMLAAATASVKLANDFETSLAKVSTLVDTSVVSMDEMGEGARELAVEYGMSASDINEAVYQSISASVDAADAVEFVGKATKLAKAGFTDSATAVDTLTTAINAYGMSADDATHISDVLVNTQNLGKTTVNELGSSMGQVIPSAAAYGVSLENLASAYVSMTKQGINTANATTYINGMFTELASEGSDVAKILNEKTGKSFGQLMNDGMSLGDVLQVVYESVGYNSEAFANLWGNVRAGKGALALANGGVEEFNATLASMVNATGVVDSAFGKIDGTTQEQYNRMKAEVEDAAITVGQAFLPVVQDAVGVVKDVAQAFNEMDESEQKGVIRTAMLVAGLGPAITLLGTLLVNVERVGGGMMSFATLLAKLDAATGGVSRGFNEIADSAGNITKAAKPASVAMGALKAGAAAAAVAGIALLVSAIKDYVEKQQQFNQATKGLVDAAKSLDDTSSGAAGALDAISAAADGGKKKLHDYGKEIDRLVQKQASLADEMSSSFGDTAAKNGALQAYADKIKELAGHCDKDARKLAELKAAVEGYNSIAGTSYQVTDNMTGALDVSTSALQNNADAWKANAEAQAIQSAMTKLLEERIGIDQMLSDAEAELADATNAVDEAMVEGDPYIEADLQRKKEAQERVGELTALLEKNEEAERKLTDRMVDATAKRELASATLDDYAIALGEAEEGTARLQALAGDRSMDEFVESLREAGISASDFASVGADAFALLSDSAGGDLAKVKEYIDSLNSAGIDVKTLHVDDDGTVRDAEDNVIDLDKQTINDKSFKVEAITYQAEQSLSRLKNELYSLTSSAFTVNVNTVTSHASGGLSQVPIKVMGHASGGIATGPTLTNVGLIGEDGAEAVMGRSLIPLTNSHYVRPFAQAVAAEMQPMGVSESVVYNINVTAGSDGDDIARTITHAIKAQELMRRR